ncbi:OmpP1/FadL family transporter [Halotalea alkalilenta]|uniref:OmpP1/FadL family transporter n=1 Tax=Halotalea alkalilenta TaxID=376489 RepID=UPI00048671BF|nr:outer membrane protein transport protein [Halotalea alkalilenta]
MNTRSKSIVATFTVLAAGGLPAAALAGGWQLNEQSVSAQGAGFAGRSSNVQDASIVHGNPAGISFLDRAQLSVGGTYLDVKTKVRDSNGYLGSPLAPNQRIPTAGASSDDMVPGTLVPFGFFAMPLDQRWGFGFGVYSPFGAVTDYGHDFQGRYFGDYTSVRVITAQPTISYKFNDRFSVGLGITYNRVDGELRSFTPDVSALASGSGRGEGRVNVRGDDEAWGYNLGMMYRPSDATTLGLSYRSKVSYHLDGRVHYTNVAGQGTPSADNPLAVGTTRRGGSLALTTPETIDLSVTHKIDDRWTVMAGAAWVRWSQFREIHVRPEGSAALFEQQDYKNAWQFALGGSYQLDPKWVLRAGLSYDKTPTEDGHRSVRIPTDDRYIASIGAGWTPIPELTLDFAYSYLQEVSSDVDQQRSYGGGLVEANYSARYRNKAHGFGAQLSYRF